MPLKSFLTILLLSFCSFYAEAQLNYNLGVNTGIGINYPLDIGGVRVEGNNALIVNANFGVNFPIVKKLSFETVLNFSYIQNNGIMGVSNFKSKVIGFSKVDLIKIRDHTNCFT